MMVTNLDTMLHTMVEKKASDLHLRVGAPPLFRINGVLRPVPESDRLTVKELEEIANTILTEKQKENFFKELSIDTSYSVRNLTRFRVNVFQQRNTVSVVFRCIATSIPTIESLGLPKILKALCDKPQGLVLVCGPTGCGKSTTLAAMIEHINNTRNIHIITIEDPIEFLFKDNQSFITQRDVGIDTPSFEIALKNALRQDPDCILLGEMRGLETISTAMRASETGHLIFSTIHANNAYEAIARIVDSYPVELRNQIRNQLANVLLGCIAQRLIPRRDGKGRIAAVEILIVSPRIRELILKNQLRDIREEMEKSVSHYHMQSLEQSLVALIANKMVSYKDAANVTLLAGEMKLLMDKLGINVQETGEHFH